MAHYQIAAIKAHRVEPLEPMYHDMRPYHPAVKVIAKPILTSCTACNDNATHEIPDACRVAIRNMRPLPCESVLRGEAQEYRHDYAGTRAATVDDTEDEPAPVIELSRKGNPVVTNAILAYLRDNSPAGVKEVCNNVKHHRETVVELLRQLTRKGKIYSAKPIVGDGWRGCSYSLTPIHYDTSVDWDSLDELGTHICRMRLAGMTLDRIHEELVKVGIHTNKAGINAIARKGITECLVTDNTES